MAESLEARCKSFPFQSAVAWRGVRGARGFNLTRGTHSRAESCASDFYRWRRRFRERL